MPGVFELEQTNNRQFMFNLRAGNGEVILTSPWYKTKEYAEAASPARTSGTCRSAWRGHASPPESSSSREEIA
jgi:uncharacterized protein YegP (UPF0339 family)